MASTTDLLSAPPATDEVLVAHDLAKSFGDRVADAGVSFQVAPGETYGLLGPNGAGKTTTIRMVCGLLRADAGAVTIAGRTMSTTTVAAKALVGYVPQEVALYPDLTARENLRFFGRLQRLSGRVLAARVDDVFELVVLILVIGATAAGLAILTSVAVALLTLASWRLRRSLTG